MRLINDLIAKYLNIKVTCILFERKAKQIHWSLIYPHNFVAFEFGKRVSPFPSHLTLVPIPNLLSPSPLTNNNLFNLYHNSITFISRSILHQQYHYFCNSALFKCSESHKHGEERTLEFTK